MFIFDNFNGALLLQAAKIYGVLVAVVAACFVLSWWLNSDRS